MNDELRLLRDLIQTHTGLFFRDYGGLESIAIRLQPRVKENGCNSFFEYYQILNERGEAAAEEWLQVITALSRTKSSFLRHIKLAGLLANTIIPAFLLGRDQPRLRIWSAGCSTGEEPLTVAMALQETRLFERLPIEIYGTDANYGAIEKARRGLYDDSRVEILSPELRLRYFRRTKEGWQFDPGLHKRIQWRITNLIAESDIADLAKSDIIFCNNVFIYFSESTICKMLRFFGKQMTDGGYLLTDDGDYFNSLMGDLAIFERQPISGASVWRKRDADK